MKEGNVIQLRPNQVESQPKVVLSYESNGNSVVLLDHLNGSLQVVSQQRGQPSRTVGSFTREELLKALNTYHKAKDAMALVS